MNKLEYSELVKKHSSKEPKFRNAIVAFLVGGLVGFLGEVIVNVLMKSFGLSRVDSCTWLAFILILFGTFMTALGKFDNLVAKVKCGLILPTTGFAHSIQSAVMDYKKDGLITGIGSNAFKLAGSVIFFGIISAFFLVVLKVVLYG